jgi:hypothetical protein
LNIDIGSQQNIEDDSLASEWEAMIGGTDSFTVEWEAAMNGDPKPHQDVRVLSDGTLELRSIVSVVMSQSEHKMLRQIGSDLLQIFVDNPRSSSSALAKDLKVDPDDLEEHLKSVRFWQMSDLVRFLSSYGYTATFTKTE